MATRRSTARHYSVPVEASSSSRTDCERRPTWTSNPHHDQRRRRSSSSQRRFIDVAATATELQGLLPPPPPTEDQGSEEYRSAKEIFDDCFSTSTVSANTVSTAPGAKTETSDDLTRSMSRDSEQENGGGVVEGVSRPCRQTSQERRVRALVL